MFRDNLMLIEIQSVGGIALITVSSDIVIILLNEDTAAHSRFKILIDIPPLWFAPAGRQGVAWVVG